MMPTDNFCISLFFCANRKIMCIICSYWWWWSTWSFCPTLCNSCALKNRKVCRKEFFHSHFHNVRFEIAHKLPKWNWVYVGGYIIKHRFGYVFLVNMHTRNTGHFIIKKYVYLLVKEFSWSDVRHCLDTCHSDFWIKPVWMTCTQQDTFRVL